MYPFQNLKKSLIASPRCHDHNLHSPSFWASPSSTASPHRWNSEAGSLCARGRDRSFL